jgi:hypothetical protein
VSRNHLLILSMTRRRPAPPSVWRMTLDLLGHAFGVAVSPERRS